MDDDIVNLRSKKETALISLINDGRPSGEVTLH